MLAPNHYSNRTPKVRIPPMGVLPEAEGWITGVAFVSGKKGPVKYLIKFRTEEVRYIHQDHIERIDEFKGD